LSINHHLNAYGDVLQRTKSLCFGQIMIRIPACLVSVQNQSRLRMALLPTPCEVLETPGIWVPLAVAAGNVYILPGIPRLFQQMIEANKGRFVGPKGCSTTLLSDLGEGDLAAQLDDIAKKYPGVRIGSYPNTAWDMNRPDQDDALAYRVKLVFEGRQLGDVEAAVGAALDSIPQTRRVSSEGQVNA
jgi:molybdopterin-biosynthesis enzyme MoeA-like protein